MEVSTEDRSVIERTHRTRQSARLVGVSSGKMRNPSDPLRLSIPTGQRTVTKTRPRNLQKDNFVYGLTKLSKEMKIESSMGSVAVASQKEREVAEALSSLRNMKCEDVSGEHIGTISDFIQDDEGWYALRTDSKHKNQASITHDSSRRNSRWLTKAPSKKRAVTSTCTHSSRKRFQMDSEDGSYSSGSYELSKQQKLNSRTRNVNKEKIMTPPRKAIFRENGRRVYPSQGPQNDQGATRPSSMLLSHMDYPSKRQQQHQQVQSAKAESENGGKGYSGYNGRNCKSANTEPSAEGNCGDDPISQMIDKPSFPVAVMDALKRVYGSRVLCTRTEIQQIEDVSCGTDEGKLHMNVAGQTNSKANVKETSIINSSCNASKPCLKNNSRHLHIAQMIKYSMETAKDRATASEMIPFNENRNQDIPKHLPKTVPHETEMMGIQQFFPSLPIPVSFQDLSMPLPSLPQSLIHTIRNSASSTNGNSNGSGGGGSGGGGGGGVIPSLQFPTFTPQPLPLVRSSEPLKESSP